jgi:putative ABC transport system permease protein
MKYLPLIWAGLWRRPVRTALTMISIASAFVLFGVLQGFSSGLDELVTSAQADVLATYSRMSGTDRLPISDLAVIRGTPGVIAAGRFVGFGGIYQPPADFVPAQGLEGDELRAIDDKLRVTPAQWAAMKATRAGALAPADLATTHGWKVGDRIALKPQMYVNRDGSDVWQVDLLGIYPSNLEDYVFNNIVILNYDYVDQSRADGAGTVDHFLVRVASPAVAGKVASSIDAAFKNSAHATETYSLRLLAISDVDRLGDVGLAVRLISGAVFFALLFSVGAVMIQAGRERTVEFGVLKAMGFGDRSLIAMTLAEALVLSLVAAAVGLAISNAVYPLAAHTIHFNVRPGAATLPIGLAYAVVLALVAGSIPAWRAARLPVVDALAGR